MHCKPFIHLLLVPCFVMIFSSLYADEDQKAALTVENISFARHKFGIEWIVLTCNQSCVPELSTLEDANPRVVIDLMGVSQIHIKQRTLTIGGKLVKRVRNYLDKETHIFRIVLDLEASKDYFVRPLQYPSDNTYVLAISERKAGGSKNVEGSSLPEKKRITILR